MPEPSILRAEHLTRNVAGRNIVDDVSLEVLASDVLAIVGPSGSGKSSLLRLLNRLDEPTSGSFSVGGADYRSIPPSELRRRVGMVMQTAHLFPGTVEENIRFGPRQQGADLPASEIERLLESVSLPGYATRDVANLSGGEAQRVSLARTLANSPMILLADEPTSALDDRSKREVEIVIRDLVQRNSLTCLIVTHDLAQAARMARRVALLDAGRVKAIGPVDEVLRAEKHI